MGETDRLGDLGWTGGLKPWEFIGRLMETKPGSQGAGGQPAQGGNGNLPANQISDAANNGGTKKVASPEY